MIQFQDNQMRIGLNREIDDSYDLIFGSDLFYQIARELRAEPLAEKYAIITDSNVEKIHAKSLEYNLNREGLDFKTFSFKAGEENKTIDSCMEIMGKMSESK